MWRTTAALLVCLAACARDATAGDVPGLFTRVRSTERFMISLIREGYDRSSTFRSLVDTLQQSNVIVYVQPAVCAGGRIRSCLTSVNGSPAERHIRINVDTRTSHNALIGTIAHELQHAVEIAEHADVFDAPAARRLYRAIGIGRCRDGLSDECETNAAIAMESRVMEELFARRASGQAGEPPDAAQRRVRSSDPGILAVLDEGAGRSGTFRGLLDTVARYSGIVYVEVGYCAFGHLNGCVLPFVAGSGGARYFRILVTSDASRVNRERLIALIGHQLRHVVEAIEDEHVVEVETLTALYRRIGTPLPGAAGGFETTAALLTGGTVLAELSVSRK